MTQYFHRKHLRHGMAQILPHVFDDLLCGDKPLVLYEESCAVSSIDPLSSNMSQPRVRAIHYHKLELYTTRCQVRRPPTRESRCPTDQPGQVCVKQSTNVVAKGTNPYPRWIWRGGEGRGRTTAARPHADFERESPPLNGLVRLQMRHGQCALFSWRHPRGGRQFRTQALQTHRPIRE